MNRDHSDVGDVRARNEPEHRRLRDAARRFEGAVALITGAASGIGAATARRLAAEGAFVLVTDIDEEAGTELAVAIGGEFRYLDVTSEAGWAAAVPDRLDVLHLNTGRNPATRAPLHEVSTQDWDSVLALTLRSVHSGVRAAIPALRAAAGNIVLTGSIHSRLGLPGSAPYAAAKGAVSALIRQLAVDYGPEVRVNGVLPGPIRTPAWGDWDGKAHTDRTIAGRAGTPEEVAAAVAFLASADASYITGTELLVDGGWAARGM
ncbi:SDR family oxidoreductase [Pseudonocardiaceae bacterium YIM PH 21723]|nr:SDR family oxidoreductase [Pseudonocardiaceae bacterium YIM PH 21723]